MASGKPNQKRKRVLGADASGEANEKGRVPKKRKRDAAPPDIADGQSHAEEDANEGQISRKRGGRPRKAAADRAMDEAEVAVAPAPALAVRKSARASLKTDGGKAKQADKSGANGQQQQKKTATRRVPARPKGPEEQQPDESPVRRSRRNRRSADEQPWWKKLTPSDAGRTANRDDAEDEPAGPKRRGRVSAEKAQKQASSVQELPPGKRKGPSPKALAKPDAITAKRRRDPSHSAQGSGAVAERRRSPRTSDAAKKGGDAAPAALKPHDDAARAGWPRRVPKQPAKESDPQPASRRRRPSDHEGVADDKADKPRAAKFSQLVPVTRQILRSTISAKWTPLDEASIAAVKTVVSDAGRAVLLRLRDRQQTHDQAQHVLGAFAARLQSKLRKGLPFPPAAVAATKSGGGGGGGGSGGHADELDFEKTVGAIQALEAALDPLLHSVALLRREKEREEAALERDYALLRTLETNARAEAAAWREREKRAHALAPEPRRSDGLLADGGDEGALVLARPGPRLGGGILKDLEDEEIKSLWQQVGSHMESMRSNLSQIDGVLPAIAQSQAALRETLFKHLSPDQYEEVLLG